MATNPKFLKYKEMLLKIFQSGHRILVQAIIIGVSMLLCGCFSARATKGSEPMLSNFIAAVLMEKQVTLPYKVIAVDISRANANYIFNEVVTTSYESNGMEMFEIFSQWSEQGSEYFYFLNISGFWKSDTSISIDRLVFYTPNDQIVCTWMRDNDGDKIVDSITHKESDDQDVRAHQSRLRYILQFHTGYGNLLLQQSYELAELVL